MLSLNDCCDKEHQTISFNFETGEYSGRQYTAGVEVCPNPVCICEVINLDVLTGQSNPDVSLHIRFNITEHTLENEGQGQEAQKLANALVEQLTENDWCLLEGFYFDTKARQTETVTLEEIDAIFPPVILEDESAMVGLLEVLPYAKLITVELDGLEYLLEEWYCVRPYCDCQDAGVVFLPSTDSSVIPDNPPFVFVSYVTKRWSMTDAGDYEQSLVERLADKAIKEGCCKTLRARHSKMRSLYKLYKKRHYAQTRLHSISETQKVGRNDPCPCGSGKKYKRCCLT